MGADVPGIGGRRYNRGMLGKMNGMGSRSFNSHGVNPGNRKVILRGILLITLMAILGLLASCSLQFPGSSGNSPDDSPVTPTVPPLVSVYFTNPGANVSGEYRGGIDEYLVQSIDSARLSVEVAAYSFNLWSLRDALLRAHQRGVVVRMVIESDNMDNAEVQDLREAGIVVLGDQHESLMHNKFIVIDQSEVWTGSMNYTVSGVYLDDNNLVHLRSEQIAQAYHAVFTEMFENAHFGAYSRQPGTQSEYSLNGNRVEVYFSPEDGVAGHILPLLEQAQESIFFLSYVFTSNDLGSMILQRATQGVTISGVMEADQVSSQGTEYETFRQAGLDVRLDANPDLMHHKIIIIDRKIVISGSYNFTRSAEIENDENLVIIHDPGVAASYLAEFARIHDQAIP